jgi:hypothetical protein
VVGPDDVDAGKLTVRACGGLKGELVHPADLAQVLLHLIHELQCALHGLLGAYGWISASPGRFETSIVDLGLYFMVQEPSG